MTDRQRLFNQKGQVDTQWEMRGSPSAIPSSEIVAEYDTSDPTGPDDPSSSFGGAGNLGQKNSQQEAVWQQNDQVDTQPDKQGFPGTLPSDPILRSYKDNWDDLAGS